MGALGVVDKLDLACDLVTAVRSAAAGKVFFSRNITKSQVAPSTSRLFCSRRSTALQSCALMLRAPLRC